MLPDEEVWAMFAAGAISVLNQSDWEYNSKLTSNSLFDITVETTTDEEQAGVRSHAAQRVAKIADAMLVEYRSRFNHPPYR